MRDSSFSLFIESIGEANSRTEISDSTITAWSNKLPPVLLEIWRQEGWACYGNGRFWTVDPAEYEHIKDAWLEGTPLAALDTFHVIARSAFGDLYLCGEKTGASTTIISLHNEILAQKNRLKTKSLEAQNTSIQALFGVSDPEDFDYQDPSGKLLFERAVKKYGPLAPDEMYGFEPALVLGGSPTLESLRRLKLDPHLLILRNFDTPTLPFSGVDLEKLMK
ncbi:GAD-like domain-containing protein [Pseudomonas aeruginosa]